MRDWQRFVRERLSLPRLQPEREDRIVRELAAQLEDCYREARSRGLSEDDADRQARSLVADWAGFGSAIQQADWNHGRSAADRLAERAARTGSHSRGRGGWIADLQRDLAHGLRLLNRHPLLLTVVIVTLGLAIGGTTTLFTFVNGVLLQPLPYSDPASLVRLREVNLALGQDWGTVAPANLFDWRRQSRTLAGCAPARSWPFVLREGAESIQVAGGYAGAGLFRLLGAELTGRDFADADSEPGAGPAAILSYGFWQSRFGGDPAVVGRRLETDQLTARVVGVLPVGFEVPKLEGVDLWVSFPAEWTARRDWRGFFAFGRLAAGGSVAAARTELESISAELARQFPDENSGFTVRVDSLHSSVVAPVRQPLIFFMTATVLVLLVACGNVGSLLLARTASRTRELALRAALGAGRARLIRQFVAENLLLTLIGGGVGVLLAWWLTDLVLGLAPPGLPRFDEVRVNGSVLGFALAVSLAVCLFLGVAQSFQSRSSDVADTLRAGRASDSGAALRLRRVLVAAQIALTLMLLVGAGLLIRSFANLLDWQPGFETGRVVTTFMQAPFDRYPDGESIAGLFERAVARTRSLPGVASAGAASAGPMFGGGDGQVQFLVEGRPAPPDVSEAPLVSWFDVLPGYFSTIGIPVRRGRPFTANDDRATPPVAIVNETAARRYWPDQDPVGARIRLTDDEDGSGVMEIVGVVADVPPFRPDEAPGPEIYWPLAQKPRWGSMLVVRTAGRSDSIGRIIHRRLAEAEPDLQLGTFQSLDERAGRQLVRPRFFMLLMGLFAALALAISTVGLYGIVSWSVASRTREIGTRLALGADRRDVLRLVLVRGVWLTLAGVGAGLLGAVALTQMLTGLLVAVEPTDAATMAAAAALLAAVALLACFLPARRAIRVDPVVALRTE